MIELDFTRCKTLPREHQRLGVKMLVKHPYFALFDEVGAGKSKQIVDAAHFLFEHTTIDTLLVITPGFARSVWADEDPVLGEVAKHAWDDVSNIIHEYHARSPVILWDQGLNWVVTNYEFIRREDRLDELMRQLKGRKVWLVCDEAWAIKGRKSDQTRACLKLRRKLAARITILNGTPLADGSPGDLYSQMNLLDPSILECPNWTTFRSRYAIMGGFMGKQVVDWHGLDDLNARIAPHVLSRKTRECFDLPPVLDPIIIEARLTPKTWTLYKQMRDDFVAWLDVNKSQASIARQGIVRGLRLAQITSGFLGGVESLEDEPTLEFDDPRPAWLLKQFGEAPSKLEGSIPSPNSSTGAQSVENFREQEVVSVSAAVQEVGSEKLDALMQWLEGQPRPHKLLVWCRFRAELNRAAIRLESLYPLVHRLWGGQKREERQAAKEALAPGGDTRPAAVVGQPQAGGAALNLAATNIGVYLSNDFSLKTRVQSRGRIDRPGQTQPILFVDVLATGPKGQRTVDHHIIGALRRKEDMARWTIDEWRRKLLEE